MSYACTDTCMHRYTHAGNPLQPLNDYFCDDMVTCIAVALGGSQILRKASTEAHNLKQGPATHVAAHSGVHATPKLPAPSTGHETAPKVVEPLEAPVLLNVVLITLLHAPETVKTLRKQEGCTPIIVLRPSPLPLP